MKNSSELENVISNLIVLTHKYRSIERIFYIQSIIKKITEI